MLGSGFHFGLPYPIEEVIKIPITEVQEVRSRSHWFCRLPCRKPPGMFRPPGPSLNPMMDGYAITADRNIIHAKATYGIASKTRCAVCSIFLRRSDQGLTGISNAVLNVLDNALVYAAARSRLDEVLFEKTAFQDAVQRRVVQLVLEQKLGVTVEQCLVETRQPRQLDMPFKFVTGSRGNAAPPPSPKPAVIATRNSTKRKARPPPVSTPRKRSAMTWWPRSKATPGCSARSCRRIAAIRNCSCNSGWCEVVLGRAIAGVDYKMYLPTTTRRKPTELRLNLNREPMKIGGANPRTDPNL